MKLGRLIENTLNPLFYLKGQKVTSSKFFINTLI